MSQITLKPLDDGQKAVEIPLGKTTIGRGQFLGCSDKKVSRNHAVLEVTSKGEVYLTPTHVNPCFYQPTAESPGQILKKDIPHKLKNGDSFSLLPRAYRYQLIVVGDAQAEKCSEQTELSQPSAKTNGSAENDSEEANKASLEIDEVTPEGETEKIASKSEDASPKTDKNNSNDENVSKKATPSESIQTSPLKETNNKKEVEQREPTPPKREGALEGKEDTLPEADSAVSEKQKEEQTEHSISENDESLGEQTKSDLHKTELAVKENSSPRSSALDSEKSINTKEEKKTDDCEESRDEGTLDTLPSKESVSEDETVKPFSSRPEPTAKRGRKRGPVPKQPPKESIVTKRKKAAASDTRPKPKRGRKAANKFDFGPGEEGHSQQQVAGRTSSRTNRQTRQGLSLEDFIVSDDEEWQSDRSEPKRRRQKRGSRRGDDSGSDWEVDHKKTKKPVHKVGGSGSESGSDWGSHKKKKVGGAPRGRRKNAKTASSDIGSDEETDQPPSNAVKSSKTRIPCTYGKKCYRRNQNHVDQFSHPGDSDYASSDQEEEETPKNEVKLEVVKKECPYGENCFRKNAQHKKDFKHTKKVRPQREAAKQADKKAKSSRSSDEIDSYDLNDSFLNDSSDEYKAPGDSGSDSEGKEKTKRFVKGGKSKRGRKV